MKKLIILLLLAFTLAAQTYKESSSGDNKVYFMYENAMTDSVGNYYHTNDGNYIPANSLSPSATFVPISWIHSSTEGAVSITTTLEGRNFDYVNGTWGPWVTIDTIASASSTETLQFSAVGLAGGERPDQVRLKFDGQSGNRNDTVIKAWVIIPHDN